jgi:hypothetical protein
MFAAKAPAADNTIAAVVRIALQARLRLRFEVADMLAPFRDTWPKAVTLVMQPDFP